MLKNKSTRKELSSQLSLMQGELAAMKVEIANKQKALSQKTNIAIDLKNQIKLLDNPENTTVSEHAIIRYLERVKGIDIKELEKEILSEGVLKMIEVLGNGSYPNQGFKVVVKGNTVVTVTN